ncbi:hypothetical protein V6N13_084327 [Hibiscus sabdariffa]
MRRESTKGQNFSRGWWQLQPSRMPYCMLHDIDNGTQHEDESQKVAITAGSYHGGRQLHLQYKLQTTYFTAFRLSDYAIILTRALRHSQITVKIKLPFWYQ